MKTSTGKTFFIKSYTNYLKTRQFTPKTIDHHHRHIERFFKWQKKESLAITECKYNDLLSFIAALRKEGMESEYIGRHIATIRFFYQHLKQIGLVESNPAINLYLKGSVERVPKGMLERDELEKLYQDYQRDDLKGKRNKVMLSLLVYQGLRREELERAEPRDIDLKRGTIEISGGFRKEGRVLRLEGHQVFLLTEYIKEHWRVIRRTVPRPTRKLFMPFSNQKNIRDELKEFRKELTAINPEIRSLMQLRQSVVTLWVRERNIREAQYLSGHATIWNTQRYRQANVKELKESLEKFHPLR